MSTKGLAHFYFPFIRTNPHSSVNLQSVKLSESCCVSVRIVNNSGSGCGRRESGLSGWFSDRSSTRSRCVSLLPTSRSTHHSPPTMSELLAEIRKIPPVTRFVCASTIAVTLPVMAKTISPYTMIFVKEYVVKRWEACLSTHHSRTLQLIHPSHA